jgi:hypothetical protein
MMAESGSVQIIDKSAGRPKNSLIQIHNTEQQSAFESSFLKSKKGANQEWAYHVIIKNVQIKGEK